MWDAQFVEEELDEWRRLRDVLWGHCADVGRDPSEITLSSHLQVDPEPDPTEVAGRADALFEAGLDLVIVGYHRPARRLDGGEAGGRLRRQ